MKCLAAILLLCVAGCAHPVPPPDVRQHRYVVIAYDVAGNEVQRATFGEYLRGGEIVVTDSASDYRLYINPDVPLNILDSWAGSHLPRSK